jgi:hypothetical protein
LIEYDEDIASFYVEVDYIIVVRHHVMSQQLSSSNCRQLGIATDPSVAVTAFKSVTGLEPPSSPINLQTYAEAGLPVKIRAESDVEVESLAVGVEGALGALHGVDAWNRRNESRIHGGTSIIDLEAEVEGYTDDGLYIAAAQDIITLDVDDTLPGLQNWSDRETDESEGNGSRGWNQERESNEGHEV